jgi:hypothetical protein
MVKRNAKHDETFAPLARSIEVAFRTEDLSLLVLRCHMVIETLLYRLLAARLDVESAAALPNLPFSALAAVTLVGDRFDELRPQIERLNAIRNQVAHDLHVASLDHDIASFVERCTSTIHSRERSGEPAAVRFKRCVLATGRELSKAIVSELEWRADHVAHVVMAMNLETLGFNVDALKTEHVSIDEHGRLVADIGALVRPNWPLFPWRNTADT